MQNQPDTSLWRPLHKQVSLSDAKRNYLDTAISTRRVPAQWRMATAMSRWSSPLTPAEQVTVGWSSSSSNKGKTSAMLSDIHTWAILQRKKLYFLTFVKRCLVNGFFSGLCCHPMRWDNSMFLKAKKGRIKTDQQYHFLQCTSIFFLEKLCKHHQFSHVQWYSSILQLLGKETS